MKKRICILFVIAALLTACGNGETAETEKTADTAGGTDTETAAETLSEKEQLLAALPTGDYGGYDFMMLNNESNFAYTQMGAEELTGEGINDAIYNRNLSIGERFNVKIVGDMDASAAGKLTSMVKAGDST